MSEQHKLLVLLVFGLASLAQAQGVSSGSVGGTVKAIDVKKKAVTVLCEDNKQTTVISLNDETEILLDRKPVTLDQIKDKQAVRAYFGRQGDRIVLRALHIFVETSPPLPIRGKDRGAIAKLLRKSCLSKRSSR